MEPVNSIATPTEYMHASVGMAIKKSLFVNVTLSRHSAPLREHEESSFFFFSVPSACEKTSKAAGRNAPPPQRRKR